MKKIILGFILGVIVSGTVGVLASTIISSSNVTYQNKTVNTALDELYNEAITGKELVAAAITNKGIATTSSDTYETMATNINNIDTDHTEINQKINNLESKHNSDVASLTGSISNLNQSLTNISQWKTQALNVSAGTGNINISYPENFNEIKINVKYNNTICGSNIYLKNEIPESGSTTYRMGFYENSNYFGDTVVRLSYNYFNAFYRDKGTIKQTYVDIYYR